MPLFGRQRKATNGALVVLTADQHCNSEVGLCPPMVALDTGAHHLASPAQEWIWTQWQTFWDRVEALKQGRTLYVVFNGDVPDLNQHDQTRLVSRNQDVILELAAEALERPMALADYAFMIRGTEAHVGRAGWMEERIAHDLHCVQDPDTDLWSWWHLDLDVEGVHPGRILGGWPHAAGCRGPSAWPLPGPRLRPRYVLLVFAVVEIMRSVRLPPRVGVADRADWRGDSRGGRRQRALGRRFEARHDVPSAATGRLEGGNA